MDNLNIPNLSSEQVQEIDDTITANQEANERSGFPNLTDSEILWDNGTRTLTIQPKAPATSFTVWLTSTKYVKSAPETKQILDVEGVWFFYYDSSGVLQATQSFSDDIITKYAFVAALTWDATNSKTIGDGPWEERHGIQMDGMDHLIEHTHHGAYILSGFALNSIDTDQAGDQDAHAQLGVDSGDYRDEDILHPSGNLSAPANLTVLYKDGASGNWREKVANNFPVISFSGGSNRLAYNQFTGGAWQQTEVPNNQFVLAHIFTINGLTKKVIAIQGQDTYTTIISAREGALTEINALVLAGLPSLEMVAIGTVIFQTSDSYTNSVKARTRTTDTGDDWIDFRFADINRVAGAVANHNDLANRGAVGSHPGSAISLDTSSFAGLLSASEDSVQEAMDVLDDTTLEAVRAVGNQLSGDIDMNSNFLLNVPSPTLTGHAVNKGYADALAQNFKRKENCTVATTGNITLSGEQTIDGVLTSTDRVLVWQQTAPAENGIYVSAAGAWTRATDADTGAEIVGAGVKVLQGATYTGHQFNNSNSSAPNVGTDPITFVNLGESVVHNYLLSIFGSAAGYHSTQAVYDALHDVNAQLTALHTDGSPTFDDVTLTGFLSMANNEILSLGAADELKILQDTVYGGQVIAGDNLWLATQDYATALTSYININKASGWLNYVYGNNSFTQYTNKTEFNDLQAAVDFNVYSDTGLFVSIDSLGSLGLGGAPDTSYILDIISGDVRMGDDQKFFFGDDEDGYLYFNAAGGAAAAWFAMIGNFCSIQTPDFTTAGFELNNTVSGGDPNSWLIWYSQGSIKINNTSVDINHYATDITSDVDFLVRDQDNGYNIFADANLKLVGIGVQPLTANWGKITVEGVIMTREQASSPSTDISNYGKFYCKTDGKPYFRNDAGTEYDLSSGGGGGGQYGSPYALTSGTSVSWDVTNGQMATLSIAHNVTSFAITNEAGGYRLLLIITQTSGSNTITGWDANIKWVGGNAPVLSSGAGEIDVIEFICDGTNIFGVVNYDYS